MKRKQEHACVYVYVCEGVPIGGFECITKIRKNDKTTCEARLVETRTTNSIRKEMK